MTAAQMHRMHALYGRDRYEGTHLPAVAEPRVYAELFEVRAAPRAVLVLVREGNHLHLIEATRCDEPGLEVLSPSDRARIASAVHTWARDAQEGGDVA